MDNSSKEPAPEQEQTVAADAIKVTAALALTDRTWFALHECFSLCSSLNSFTHSCDSETVMLNTEHYSVTVEIWSIFCPD